MKDIIDVYFEEKQKDKDELASIMDELKSPVLPERAIELLNRL